MANVTWKTGDNRNVNVKIEKGMKEVSLDGHLALTLGVVVTASVDGRVIGRGLPVGTSHPLVVAKIGKLGITQTNLDRLNEAISDIEESDKCEMDYDALTEKMNATMDL